MKTLIKKKPGPDTRTEKQKSDDIMTYADALFDLERPSNPPPEFPNIPLRRDGVPARRLTVEEEKTLVVLYQEYSNTKARDILILSQIGMLHNIVNKYFRRRNQEDTEEAVQEGYKGLFVAVDKFKLSVGTRFSTYACWWMRSYVQRYSTNLHKFESAPVEGAEAGVRGRLGRLDDEMFDDESATLHEVIPSDLPDPESVYSSGATKHFVQRAVKKAAESLREDPRIIDIMFRRVLSEDPMTLEQLGNRHNLSREGARLLEKKILKAIKANLEKSHRVEKLGAIV